MVVDFLVSEVCKSKSIACFALIRLILWQLNWTRKTKYVQWHSKHFFSGFVLKFGFFLVSANQYDLQTALSPISSLLGKEQTLMLHQTQKIMNETVGGGTKCNLLLIASWLPSIWIRHLQLDVLFKFCSWDKHKKLGVMALSLYLV